jgi:hypothetical protein
MIDEGVRLAREAADLGARTEYFEVHVAAVTALGEVLRLARSDEADGVLRDALAMQERKGNLVAAERLRQVLGPPAT